MFIVVELLAQHHAEVLDVVLDLRAFFFGHRLFEHILRAFEDLLEIRQHELSVVLNSLLCERELRALDIGRPFGLREEDLILFAFHSSQNVLEDDQLEFLEEEEHAEEHMISNGNLLRVVEVEEESGGVVDEDGDVPLVAEVGIDLDDDLSGHLLLVLLVDDLREVLILIDHRFLLIGFGRLSPFILPEGSDHLSVLLEPHDLVVLDIKLVHGHGLQQDILLLLDLLDVLLEGGLIEFDEWVVEDLRPRNTVLVLHHQHLLQQVLDRLGTNWLAWEIQRNLLDVLEQLVGRIGGPWGLAIEHLVQHHPEGPNVALG